MKLIELINQKRAALNAKIHLYNELSAELDKLRGDDSVDPEKVTKLRADKIAAKTDIDTLTPALDELEREAADDARMTQDAEVRNPGARLPGQRDTVELTRGSWVDTDTGERASLSTGERLSTHPSFTRSRSHDIATPPEQFGGIGQMVRALSTTSGSAVVPTVWADDIIDRVRNAAAVIRAGATIVPMAAKVVNIGRLTGDPTAAFRAENSLITASDPVFDNVTLTAKTQSALVIGSLEWFQDADNADTLVSDAIAKAIALQLDLVSLYGGITTGAGAINLPVPPNPRGVLAALQATLPGNVLGGATNGTIQTTATFYNEMLDAIFKVRDGNEEPNAMIYNSKLARTYAQAYDTTGQPLRAPADVENLTKLVSNQIPTYTQGTQAAATDLFVGDWSQLLIGQRLGLTIQVLTERYAEYGQIGIVAHWRGDVQPARSTAFSVYRAIRGAA